MLEIKNISTKSKFVFGSFHLLNCLFYSIVDILYTFLKKKNKRLISGAFRQLPVTALFFALTIQGFSVNIDSLRSLLENKNIRDNSPVYYELSRAYRATNTDSTLFYAELGLKEAEKHNNPKQVANAYNSIGVAYYLVSDFETALKYCRKSAIVSEKNNLQMQLGNAYSNMGSIYDNLGNNEKSLEYQQKGLKVRIRAKDTLGIAASYSELGTFYYSRGEMKRAVLFYKKSLALGKKKNDKRGMTIALFNLGNIYWTYGELEKARKCYSHTLKIGRKSNDNALIINSLLRTGELYFYSGKTDKAVKRLKEAVQFARKKKLFKNLAEVYNSLAIIYEKYGDFKTAIEYYDNSLKISEKIQSKEDIAIALNNLGSMNYAWGKYEQALDYFNQSLSIRRELEDKQGTGSVLGNIAGIYWDQGKYKKAKSLYFKSKNIYEDINDIYGLTGILANISDIYIYEKKYDSAEVFLNAALDINKEIENYEGTANCYIFKAHIQMMKKKYFKAIDLYNESLNIAKQLNNVQLIMSCYKGLSDSYFQNGEKGKAFEFLNNYIVLKDSVFNATTHKQISELQMIYETEKKEQQIITQQKEMKLQRAENLRTTILLYAALGGVALLLGLAFVIYRSYRQKKIANKLLAEKNEEIAAQRDLAAQQRDIISEQKQEITDSIKYAYRIQSAVIPSDDFISQILTDYFILYKPRDIVSGDFYWIGQQAGKIIIMAADCTGHGVPGAFMSMLGVAFLNEIVNKQELTNPAEILNNLRLKVIDALKQEGREGESKDGMDVAAFTLDPENNTIEFAGANNPLYLIQNNELVETKGNKMPVAIYEKMDPFVSHQFKVNKGDSLYIFSDGFADQFGGPKGKKFKYKTFKDLLVELQNHPMKKQYEILNARFEEWRGEYEQVDDVLVIGIRI